MKNFKLITAISGLLLVSACNNNNTTTGNPNVNQLNAQQAAALNAQLAQARAQAQANDAAKTAAADKAKKDKDAADAAAKAAADKKKTDAEGAKYVRKCKLPDVLSGLDKATDLDVKTLKGDYQLDEAHAYLYTDTPDANAGALYAHMKTADPDPTLVYGSDVSIECNDYNEKTPVSSRVELAELIHSGSGAITLRDIDPTGANLEDSTNIPTLAYFYADTNGKKEFRNMLIKAPFHTKYLSSLYAGDGAGVRYIQRPAGQDGFAITYNFQSQLKNKDDAYDVNEIVLITYKPVQAK